MTTPPRNFDVAALDAIIGEHSNAWYSRGCAVGRLVQSIDAPEFRARLIAHLDDQSVGHAALTKAILETTGESVRHDTMRRHRLRLCACGDETRS